MRKEYFSKEVRKRLSLKAKQRWKNPKFRKKVSRILKRSWDSNPKMVNKMRKINLGKNNPMYGKKQSKEVKHQKSLLLKKMWKSQRFRKKTIEAARKNWKNPALRKRMIQKYWLGKKRSKETKLKISENLKGNIPWNVGIPMPKKDRIKMSKVKMKFWKEHPEARKKQSRIMLHLYRDYPEIIERMRQTQIKRFKNPEARKRLSKSISQIYFEHPEVFENFVKSYKKVVKPQKRTKFGFLVRSEPEKVIANWLYDHKIKTKYEEILFLGDHLVLPDFFLPKYKLYIEYFGQFRYNQGGLSLRTKQKLRLYKKYKIKLISLFPKDLGNLDEKFRVIKSP